MKVLFFCRLWSHGLDNPSGVGQRIVHVVRIVLTLAIGFRSFRRRNVRSVVRGVQIDREKVGRVVLALLHLSFGQGRPVEHVDVRGVAGVPQRLLVHESIRPILRDPVLQVDEVFHGTPPFRRLAKLRLERGLIQFKCLLLFVFLDEIISRLPEEVLVYFILAFAQ